MKAQEIRELSTPELKERLAEEKTHLNKMKLSHAISPIENTNIIKEHKKSIARIHTELRKREIAE